MEKKKAVDSKQLPQDKIDVIEKKYARVRGNAHMELLLNAVKEYITEKGKE